MKKIYILALFFFLFYLSEAASIGKNGAVRKCYKKVKKSVPSGDDNNNNNDNSSTGGKNGPKVSCKSLISEIDSTKDAPIPIGGSHSSSEGSKVTTNNNTENGENSEDDDNNSVKINYTDNLVVPKGTVLNDNEFCVTAIYNINKLLKQANNNFSFEQSCDKEFDIEGFTKGLTDMKINIYSVIEEAINKCGKSKIWNGAKIHQACRVLSKTGQTVCHSLVDDTYEKYDHQCLKNATFLDMWEYSKWLWERLAVSNNGCYLKQLYNYKCSPSKDVLVTMGSNTYSLRLMCESAKNSCEWPGSYDGDNKVIRCLSKSITKNRNAALEVLKKNGYVCEGSTDLPSQSEIKEDISEVSDDEQPIETNTIPIISNQKVDTNSGTDNNNNVSGIKTDGDKKNMVSSGTEPWTNTNQIIGTIFIALFALLF